MTWLLIVALVLVIGGFCVAVVWHAANADSAPASKKGRESRASATTPKGVPEGESLIQAKPAGFANLGNAQPDAAFGPAYQSKVEQQVQALINDNKKAQLEFRNALEAQQRASEERVKELTNKFEQRLAATHAAPPPAAPAASAPAVVAVTATRVVSVTDPSAVPPAAAQFIATPSELTAGSASPAPTVSPTAAAQATPNTEAADAFVIPESGFVDGRLLNGVVARVNGEFVYTTIKLLGDYTSANHYKQNLDSCVVTGEARAAYTEGRIRIKPVKLTCTLPSGRTRSWKTSGYVVDARDAIEGVVATTVSNEEKRLAAITAGAMIESVGQLAVASESTSVYNPTTGQASSVITGDLGRAAIGGAARGAGRGFQDEARRYYELFQPSVQVGGGTPVTVFLETEAVLPDGGETLSTVRSANKGRH